MEGNSNVSYCVALNVSGKNEGDELLHLTMLEIESL